MTIRNIDLIYSLQHVHLVHKCNNKGIRMYVIPITNIKICDYYNKMRFINSRLIYNIKFFKYFKYSVFLNQNYTNKIIVY